MPPLDLDRRVRLTAFEWLRHQVDLHGDVLPWSILSRGFDFDGERVPLVSMQGIFKPKVLPEVPLSIRSSADGPYDDAFGPDGLRYAYRGTNPDHPDNRGLRAAMTRRIPLVYFHGIVEGKYLAAWPVFVVGDARAALRFTVALDDAQHVSEGLGAGGHEANDSIDLGATARRSYITATLRVRLHQRSFRERVLLAYRQQCALCRLRHDELLDAAHIIPDADDEGEPIVQNGLALCKLHHAAYDRQFLTVRPDHVIEVRQAILDEEDGPMLLHGLKGMHGQRIVLPRSRELYPDPERLARRYRLFREAV
ncbi:MAG: HNH endonuclease [Acidobacteriia bacterium]|nr:HNH endonuclease [Terriglobia bacterium]